MQNVWSYTVIPPYAFWHAQGHLYLYRSKFYDYIIVAVIVIIIIFVVIIITTIILMKPEKRETNTEQPINPYSRKY